MAFQQPRSTPRKSQEKLRETAFLLFCVCLILASHGSTVEVGGLTRLCLLRTASAAELQRLLAYIKQWADAWGMVINASAGKRETTPVDADATHAHPPHHVHDAGCSVQWTHIATSATCSVLTCKTPTRTLAC